MYESSGSQFFRTTTGTQSGPDAFNESRFGLTFLTILGVKEYYKSLVVLEGKKVKRWPSHQDQSFLKTFLPNSFTLSHAEGKTYGPLNRGGIVDLPLLRTLLAICQKSREPSFWEVIDSCFSSTYKFGSFKYLFVITSLSELYFRF